MRPARATVRAMSVLVVGSADGERRRLLGTLKRHASPGELSVTAAPDAKAALAIFRRDHSDLILVSTEALETMGRDIAQAVREEEGVRHTGLIFIDHGSRDDGALSVECLGMGADDFLRHGASPSELMARLRAVLRLKAMTDELRSANHQLRLLSMTDDLTGLANMRSFNESFSAAIRRCRRGDTALAIIMMDLDHFKSVNDTTNHLIGSHVLATVGGMLKEPGVFGPQDVAARYGGDEFIVLCEATTLDEAAQRAETVRKMIAARLFQRDGSEIRITSSLGVAWAKAGFTGRAEDLVKAADLMLYRSKDYGRNRVTGMILSYPTDLTTGAPAKFVDVTNDEDDRLIDAGAILKRR